MNKYTYKPVVMIHFGVKLLNVNDILLCLIFGETNVRDWDIKTR